MGPLQPDDGSLPVYSQLYVLDPDQAENEEEFRFSNMSLPSSTPDAEKVVLHQLLRDLQTTLANCNNYVKDLKSAAEIAVNREFPISPVGHQ